MYFSAAWGKRSLLYDQTIEDINIFSPAFLVELRGVAQLTPLSPTRFKFCRSSSAGGHGNHHCSALRLRSGHESVAYSQLSFVASLNDQYQISTVTFLTFPYISSPPHPSWCFRCLHPRQHIDPHGCSRRSIHRDTPSNQVTCRQAQRVVGYCHSVARFSRIQHPATALHALRRGWRIRGNKLFRRILHCKLSDS